MIDGMPEGGYVNLPVEWLRDLLVDTNQAGDDPDLLLSLEEVGERVGRAVSTVRTWANSGKLPGAFRLNGRDWKVPESALADYLDAQKNPNSQTGVHPQSTDLGSWRSVRRKRTA